MTDKQAIEIVKKHNAWRRGKIETEDYNHQPSEIGIAIDRVVKLAEFSLIRKSIKKKQK